MAEAGLWSASSNANGAPASAATYYGNFGNSTAASVVAETTEANAQLVHRGSNVTLKNLRVVVKTNTRAGTSTVTTRKNNADTSQVVSITASTTGTYTDLTNTVALTAGDTFAYKLVFGSTSGNLLISSITANAESAGQAFNYWSALGTVSTTTASVTRYISPMGTFSTFQGTESLAQAYLPAAGTLSNLRVNVTAARAQPTTFRTRIGGANGNQSVSITGTGAFEDGTGAFEDTTNSDTVSAGNLLAFATVTGTGTDTLTITNVSVLYAPSTANVTALGAGPGNQATLTAGVTRYYNPSGQLTASSTEGPCQSIMPFDGTASRLACTVTANAATTTTTFVLRKNAVDTGVTFNITAGATGSFADTTNSASFVATDLLSVKGSGADGTISLRSMGLAITAVSGVAGAGSATAGATASATGSATTNSVGTGVAGAVGAGIGAATAISDGTATATVSATAISAFFTAGTATATVSASGVGAATSASTGSANATVTASASTGGARRLVVMMA